MSEQPEREVVGAELADAAGDLPTYPRDSPSQSVRVTREVRLRAWVGRRDNLDRLVTIMQDSLSKVYDDAVRSLPGDDRMRRREAEHLLDALSVSSSIDARSGNIERTGTLDRILAEVDVRDVRRVRIRNSGSYDDEHGIPTIELTMKSGMDEAWPVTLKVTGVDRQWVGGMYDTLSAELRARMPWWTWLRQGRASMAVGAVCTLAFFFWRYAGSPADDRADASIVLTFALVCLVGGGFISAFALNPFFRILIPCFEIVEPGETPRGRKALTIAVGAASFFIGVAGLLLAL
ncbi:hypothetical protein [Aeromicrobium sp. 9AM]|uniref:hypothetical protein n=1 Tax=Aeromicrobium sp. 9AM TaxID=2653126 RepID=UPI0012F37378|nr:hypothetical protein [Aeromicrobium sp. 9AM]VXC09903.1 conserved membrane hypothetical protein [Aeromicrobium sp. 9AM]